MSDIFSSKWDGLQTECEAGFFTVRQGELHKAYFATSMERYLTGVHLADCEMCIDV